MKKTVILSALLFAGCAAPPHQELGTEEARIVAIARKALAEHEGKSKARDADFEVHRHGEGWVVLAIIPTRHFLGPATYRVGCDRLISIGADGHVTAYVQGH